MKGIGAAHFPQVQTSVGPQPSQMQANVGPQSSYVGISPSKAVEIGMKYFSQLASKQLFEESLLTEEEVYRRTKELYL